jgi:hypothetical protein
MNMHTRTPKKIIFLKLKKYLQSGGESLAKKFRSRSAAGHYKVANRRFSLAEGLRVPRKSAAALALLPPPEGGALRLQPRADAPANVREIFLLLVRSVAVDHFRVGDSDLVEQYAQAIALARRAYDELEKSGPVIKGKASPWLIVLEKAHRSAVALSARLRLAPQARADPKSIARDGGASMSYYDLNRRNE